MTTNNRLEEIQSNYLFRIKAGPKRSKKGTNFKTKRYIFKPRINLMFEERKVNVLE